MDTGVLGFPLGVSPRSTGVNCHLQTHCATGGKPRRTEPPKANRCPNLWQAPAPAFPRPWRARPSDLLLRVPAVLSCTCRTLDLAEGNEETAGVTVVPLFEGCPNEKQTNKSGEFRVSFKCTEMQLLSDVGDQRSLLNRTPKCSSWLDP